MNPERLALAKRIVLKLGTQIVMDPDGNVARERLTGLVDDCAALIAEGRSFLVVTSGAVGLGRQALGLGSGKLSLAQKQACAAVGQNSLMDLYRELFGRHGLVTAQLLLTAHDFSDRQRYLNLRETMETLVGMNVVPIINENDSVSVTELQESRSQSFGDNDRLSALVAGKLGADLLVIFTNVAGIYTANPATHPDAELIRTVDGFEQLLDISTEGQSTYGRGGMTSKVEAARIAAISGVQTLITSGETPHALRGVFEDEEPPGTLVLARSGMSGRKRWLGLASGYTGIITVNTGARDALVIRHASLLPSGVTNVQGDFAARQVISIQDEGGVEVGRGLTNFSSEEARRIQGLRSKEITELLGAVESDVLVHRDNLVIFEEYGS